MSSIWLFGRPSYLAKSFIRCPNINGDWNLKGSSYASFYNGFWKLNVIFNHIINNKFNIFINTTKSQLCIIVLKILELFLSLRSTFPFDKLFNWATNQVCCEMVFPFHFVFVVFISLSPHSFSHPPSIWPALNPLKPLLYIAYSFCIGQQVLFVFGTFNV